MNEVHILQALATEGFAMLPPMNPERFAEFRDFLLSRPVYVDAHVPQTARNRGEDVRFDRENRRAVVSECICVHTDDAVIAPHWMETALALTDVAAARLQRDPPVAYSSNFFWTRPGPAGTRPDIQEFHRDQDDERFLALFIYLTDVLVDDDGPHDLEGPDGVVRTVYGPAGTMFLADTSLPHRGRKPTKGERGFGWWRWGVSAWPPANEWDQIEPLPSHLFGPGRLPVDFRTMESIRLLVAP